jgi:hypothetical protein
LLRLSKSDGLLGSALRASLCYGDGVLSFLRIREEYLVGAAACFLCLLSGAVNVHFFLFSSFLVGGVVGILIDAAAGDKAAFVIAGVYLLFGAMFHLVKHRLFAWQVEE